jgi:hypothetical protein
MTLALESPLESPAVLPPAPAEASDTTESVAEPVGESLQDRSQREDAEVIEPAAPEVAIREQPAAPTAAERRGRVETFLANARLPPAMRERLAASLSQAEPPIDRITGEPLVPLSRVAALVEQALPTALLLDRNALGRPAHPAGEAFFTGDFEAVSDAQAEQVAREQLARNGYLKK